MASKGRKSSSTEQDNVLDQHNGPLASRILVRLEATKDGESDRESCASQRSQESLDIDVDLERISNMGGSQRDLRSLASPEQEPEPREQEQIDFPLTTEVTLQDCQGKPPPPHHLIGQQDDCEAHPEIRIENTQETGDTVTAPPCDDECTHSHDQKAGPPREGDADTTLPEGPHKGMGIDISTNIGETLPNRPREDHQEHLLHLQECPEVDTSGQDNEHSQSHGDQLQEMPEGVVGVVKHHPLPTDEDRYEQDWRVGEELSVSIEATPSQAGDPMAVVFGSVCDCTDEECIHHTCWNGKVVNQEGLLKLWLERELERSVRYPPLVTRGFKKEEMDTEEMV